MSVWFKSRLNPWYIWIPSNPNLYSTKIIMKMWWQTIASNVSIRTISPTATPLPKAYDCVAVYIAGRRTSLVVYGWWPQPPTKNAWTDFRYIFRVGGTWYKEKPLTFSGCSVKPLEHSKSFPTFSENSVSANNITGQLMNRFSWNFQISVHMRQGIIRNIFGMLQLTPWIQGRFFYFLEMWLLVILWKNGRTDFHEIFMKYWPQHKKYLTRLFNAWLYCLTVSHLGVTACLLVTLRQSG